MMSMRVDVWADIICPWCYIGKQVLEQALSRFERRDQVRIVWRSFELDPDASREPGVTAIEVMAQYMGGPTEARRRSDMIRQRAAEVGLEISLETARPVSTFDAHRLVHHAAGHHRADAMQERLMRAYHSENHDLADTETLVRLAGDVGLDTGEVRLVLDGDSHTADVRADEREAARLGVHGVPTFAVGGRVIASGRPEADTLLEKLRDAWKRIS